MIDKQTIGLITQKLVEAYRPKAVYLFGSYAWGRPDEGSDLDLLVVIEHSGEKTYQRLKPAYVALRGLGVPKDILVYTVREFEEQAREPSTLVYKIKREGVKLYEAA